MTWSTFFDAGGVAGLLSLGWQAMSRAIAHAGRPILIAHQFDPNRDLRVWQMGEKLFQRVLTAEVENVGKRLATRCVARVNVLPTSQGRQLDERAIPLHWASAQFTSPNRGADPVDLGQQDVERLDILFARSDTTRPGCWIASAYSMGTGGAPQHYLPPGKYDIEVVIRCEGGSGCRLAYTVESPQTWDKLEARRTN